LKYFHFFGLFFQKIFLGHVRQYGDARRELGDAGDGEQSLGLERGAVAVWGKD